MRFDTPIYIGVIFALLASTIIAETPKHYVLIGGGVNKTQAYALMDRIPQWLLEEVDQVQFSAAKGPWTDSTHTRRYAGMCYVKKVRLENGSVRFACGRIIIFDADRVGRERQWFYLQHELGHHYDFFFLGNDYKNVTRAEDFAENFRIWSWGNGYREYSVGMEVD